MKYTYRPTCSLAVALLALDLGTALAQEAPPLEATAAEQEILEQYRQEASRAGRGTRTFARDTDAKIPEDFSPWWIRGQRNTIGEAS
jgi:hypothetical protein